MKKRSKFSNISLLLTAFCALFLLGTGSVGKAEAATQGYQFDYNATDVQSGSEIEMRTLNAFLGVEPKDSTEGLSSTATVTFYSSEESVVKCEDTGIQGMTKLVRKGPGYSTITAVISDGGYNFSISCLVKVDLQITGTNFTTIDYAGHRILKLDRIGDSKRVVLKYVDDTEFQNTLVDWTSSNEQVATVDQYGNVTAVGAGRAEITVTTQTVSGQSKALVRSASVIVAPIGSFTEAADYVGYTDRISMETQKDNFMIYVNSQSASNLVWK
ncbi:MAG: Ig-like domain-containing protein, partial [Lachnospiraceae bacterium]